MSRIPTIEDITKTLGEVAQQQKELSEFHKKSEQKMRELFQASKEFTRSTNREFKKITKQLGRWGNELGYIVESAVYGNLQELLNKRNMNIERVVRNIWGKSFDGSDENWEFDFIALGRDCIVAVEAKSDLTVKDVKYFLWKLKNVTKWCPHYKGLRVYGAVAYLKDKDTRVAAFAQENGLFVIHAVGDSAKMINPDRWLPRSILQN